MAARRRGLPARASRSALPVSVRPMVHCVLDSCVVRPRASRQQPRSAWLPRPKARPASLTKSAKTRFY